MKTTQMRDIIQMKNDILRLQAKRIRILEDKIDELRKKYFQLKYANEDIHLIHDPQPVG